MPFIEVRVVLTEVISGKASLLRAVSHSDRLIPVSRLHYIRSSTHDVLLCDDEENTDPTMIVPREQLTHLILIDEIPVIIMESYNSLLNRLAKIDKILYLGDTPSQGTEKLQQPIATGLGTMGNL